MATQSLGGLYRINFLQTNSAAFAGARTSAHDRTRPFAPLALTVRL
ncbi:hypothetical protein P3T29_006558 [Kitasatospora sp. MAP5-34]|nr:hypothetical protein [Kitasatospora sp. MAP5-34]